MTKTFVTAAMLLTSAVLLFSQDQAKRDLEALQEIKAANAALIENQQKTLQALDEMEKTAEQIRAFAKRT